jgi:hypothetical protein
MGEQDEENEKWKKDEQMERDEKEGIKKACKIMKMEEKRSSGKN